MLVTHPDVMPDSHARHRSGTGTTALPGPAVQKAWPPVGGTGATARGRPHRPGKACVASGQAAAEPAP